METILVNREAILDQRLDNFAYDLRFNSPHEDNVKGCAWLNTLGDYNARLLTGKDRIFLNFKEIRLENISTDTTDILDRERVVINLSARDLSSPRLLDSISKMREEGFRFALKDFHNTDNQGLLVKNMDYVRFDVSSMSAVDIQQIKNTLSECDCPIIADGVDSYEILALCIENQICLFSGKFITSRQFSAQDSKENNLLMFGLLRVLAKPDATIEEIEHELCRDPRVPYKLLKIVNSPITGLRRTVESLKEAVVIIGLSKLKRWCYLTAMSNIEGLPQELMRVALIRARMCEILCDQIGETDPSSYFTVGLFSTLDALLDKPMSDIVEKMQLSQTLQSALVSYEGKMGMVLRLVKAYENADWKSIDKSPFSQELFQQVYLQSLKWAEQYNETSE